MEVDSTVEPLPGKHVEFREVRMTTRMRYFRCVILVSVLGIILGAAGLTQAQEKKQSQMAGQRPTPQSALSAEVDHALLTLPYYSVFDILEYRIEKQGEVVLSGKVVNPTLKTEAAAAVERIKGVKNVKNDISILPPLPSDNRLRLELFRAIYSKPGLEKYRTLAIPPIHIIVDNGYVTLIGIVDTQGDKDVAGIAAKEVPGTFGVTNDLKVEDQSRRR